jgi:hypothetical protein
VTLGAGPITSVAFLSLPAPFISTRYSNQPATVFPSSFSWTTDAAVKHSVKTAILKEYWREYGTLTNGRADNLIRRWLETDIEQAKLRLRVRGDLSESLTWEERRDLPSTGTAHQHADGCADYIATSSRPGPDLALRESCPPWRKQTEATTRHYEAAKTSGTRRCTQICDSVLRMVCWSRNTKAFQLVKQCGALQAKSGSCPSRTPELPVGALTSGENFSTHLVFKGGV